jgi:LysR family transcriptional regulator, hydrogen peroxide-inducible genes activator
MSLHSSAASPALPEAPRVKQAITIQELAAKSDLSTALDAPRPERPASIGGSTNLYRLHCFEVVVEEGGFKRATARLHTTQPALSYQIKRLEVELGAQLFYRRPGGVSPTEAGRLLYEHTQRVSAAVRRAKQAMKDLSEGATGEVRIGTVNSIGIYFMPQILWAMRERCPAAKLTVLYRDADDILDAMLANQLDVAVLADPRADRRLRYETLFEERISLVSGRTHPLFGCPSVNVQQLESLDFVALSERTPTGALISCYLDRLGVAVDPVVSTENVETVKRMVETGMGVAFLPDMVTERDVSEGPGGRLSRSRTDPPFTRRIVLVSWGELCASRAVEAFIDEVRRRKSAVKESPQPSS